jgi:hypothetical protein
MQNVLNIVEQVCKILAILATGFWAYYRFLKGRTFRPRLELSVSGTAARHEGVNCLICSMSVKNVGLSRVDIVREGTGLRVSESNVTAFQPIEAAGWTPKAVFDALLQHAWIEPNEPITEQIVIGLPSSNIILQLEFRIVGKSQEWNCMSIVDACFDAGNLNGRQPKLLSSGDTTSTYNCVPEKSSSSCSTDNVEVTIQQ